MKQIAGMWIPDSDNHFHLYLNNRQNRVNEKGTYHYDRFLKSMEFTKGFDVAVDIGAHIGLWSVHLAERFNQVWAFEPVFENFECLKKNVPNNVIIETFALSDIHGNIEIGLSDDNSGKSHVSDQYGGNAVLCRPLDYYDLNIDFLKIDVEGYELHVLHGAEDTLERCHPTVVIEDGPPELAARYGTDSRQASKFLESLGAKQRANIRHDYIFSWD